MIQRKAVLSDAPGYAKAMTARDLAEIVPMLSTASAGRFCEILRNIAWHAEAPGCEVIRQAGVLPLLFALLTRHIAEQDVVFLACRALYLIAYYGSPDVKAAMGVVPDFVSILKTAQASEFDKDFFHPSGHVADLLSVLGVCS